MRLGVSGSYKPHSTESRKHKPLDNTVFLETRQYPFHQRTACVCVLCVCTYLLIVGHASAGKLHFLFLFFFFFLLPSCWQLLLIRYLSVIATFGTIQMKSFYIGRWYLFIFLMLALLWDFLQSTNWHCCNSQCLCKCKQKSRLYIYENLWTPQMVYIYSE